jgi:hypothetical protein
MVKKIAQEAMTSRHRSARMSHVVQINSNVQIRHAFTDASTVQARLNVKMEVMS